MAKTPAKAEKSFAPWWAALAAGMTLIVIPEPLTTGLGMLIVGTTLGVGVIATSTNGKK